MELNSVRLADGCEKGLGIFGSFAQYFETVNVVPKRNNTECKHRYTKTCSIDCPSHRTGFMGSHKICWQQKGQRL
ncbi:MAG: hypothetical protein Q7U60_10425 [Candidatus Methanoperedens sp.]|nr:hypothetical protein [Candidatus Methanoperedens sp.]